MNVVELNQVTKTFGTTRAVDGLSLAVPRGSIYGFIGPNGSGKTTTLRIILSILYPDSGHVRVLADGQPGRSSDRIGYLPEERGLYKKMRVRELLRFHGELKTGRKVNAEVDAWLERLGLADAATKKIEALSKGMSQKVQFIAAAVAQPELLILDEPFSGLDPVNAEVIRTALLDLRRQGTTIILSTHDMNLAESLCDFILMIFRGQKVLDGTLAAIQDQYGADTIRISMTHPHPNTRHLPGVTEVRDLGQTQELRLDPAADPQEILAALMQQGRVRRFELTRPSLHDIFVRIARPTQEE
ncbi:MAG: ATP-binding cassette domain-containing protein [Verrucomicrobia bacterium]|nr:ATP-binding cassette domain-containing protein [Verrucomicrobiota bacterium]